MGSRECVGAKSVIAVEAAVQLRLVGYRGRDLVYVWRRNKLPAEIIDAALGLCVGAELGGFGEERVLGEEV